MDNKKEASGGIRFYLICAVLAWLFIACVILPLVIPDFSRQDYAVPLMGLSLLVPYLYFFIFGLAAIADEKKKK